MFRWFEKLVYAYPEKDPTPFPQKFFSFVWACTYGLKRYILAMTLCTVIIGVFEALLFSMLSHLVDWLGSVAPADLWATYRHNLLLLLGAILFSPVVVAAQALFKHQALAGNFPMRLRWLFHRLMLSQSMHFFQDEFAGRVTTKIMQTAIAVRDAVFIVCDILVYVGIYFISVGAVLASFNFFLLLPFLGWCVLYIVAMYFFVPRLGHFAQAQADARSVMTGRINDAYTNIATVKLFSHSQREASYARSAMQDFMLPVYGQQRLVGSFEVVNHTLNVSLIVATVSMALWLWVQGQIGPGAVAAATAMALRLNGISHWAMWEMASLFEQIGTIQDGIRVLSHSRTVMDKPGAQVLQVTRGEIHFDNVGFSYGGSKTVFDHFSLHIRPGEKVGLVGRSGAGKSTLVNLLLRFYDVEQGQIKIDGQNIADITQESLRSQIGMVTQDTSLLHRGVGDNLVYGRPTATEAEMVDAAKRAKADDFIHDLIDQQGRRGYDAHVGERGVKLSGGQRQRVAIARVMLKDAPILLLDEATSALDSEVEVAIQANLHNLMAGKTVIAIAHRLSTIAAMDRLIVLDNGRIVEEGSHHSLLSQGGLYAKLWAHQSGGFLAENV